MPTQRLQFTEWLPDQPAIGTGLQDAKNVVPVLAGYAPFPLASDFSNAATENLNSVFVGKLGDTVKLFAGGATKLFNFDPTTLNLNNVSRTGGYGGLTRWQFTQYGDVVLAANNQQRIQFWNLASSTAFQDLGAYISATYTRAATTVTVTTSSAHGYTTGNSFLFYFKSGGAADGTYTITVTGATTFTLTTAASGTITTSNVDIYSSYAPVAKNVAVVRDFLVAANVDGVTNKVQWADLNDETKWNAGATSQSDFQIIVDGGSIQNITGGEIGIIFLEKAIYRMSYIGSPYFFQFDAISRNLGCLVGNSVAQFGGMSYFLSDDGFYSCDGRTITPIGVEKIDRYFFSTFDLNNADTMSSTVDPIRKLVIWNYPTVAGGRALIIYNWQLQKWTRADMDVNYVASAASTGVTLEGIGTLYAISAGSFVVGKRYEIVSLGTTTNAQWNTIAGTSGITYSVGTGFLCANAGTGLGNGTAVSIEDIPASLDSRIWTGGKYVLAGARLTKIVTFTGANSTAELILSDIENGYNSLVNLARPLIDDGAATVSVASRRELDDNISFSTPVAAGEGGRVPLRSAGRFHRIKVNPTGLWTTAMAVDVNTETQGNR